MMRRSATMAVAELAVAALALVLAVGGCAARYDVPSVEERLVDGFLTPLAAAEMPVAVAETCRYDLSVDQPWHLYTELRVDATRARVAEVLSGQDMVLRRDHDPMILQQFEGRPGEGWNGALEAAGEKSVIKLTFNNADRESWDGAVGWAEPCPDGPHPDATPTP
jgi:hypothetical protein